MRWYQVRTHNIWGCFITLGELLKWVFAHVSMLCAWWRIWSKIEDAKASFNFYHKVRNRTRIRFPPIKRVTCKWHYIKETMYSQGSVMRNVFPYCDVIIAKPNTICILYITDRLTLTLKVSTKTAGSGTLFPQLDNQCSRRLLPGAYVGNLLIQCRIMIHMLHLELGHLELGRTNPSTRWGGSPTGKRNLIGKIFFITTAFWMFESFN